jgi:hypothetical protein
MRNPKPWLGAICKATASDFALLGVRLLVLRARPQEDEQSDQGDQDDGHADHRPGVREEIHNRVHNVNPFSWLHQ